MKRTILYIAIMAASLAGISAHAEMNLKVTTLNGETDLFPLSTVTSAAYSFDKNTFTVVANETKVYKAEDILVISHIDNSAIEAIDLGLPSGTLWASSNVNASDEDIYGGYFCWGDPISHDSYEMKNYLNFCGAKFSDREEFGNANIDPLAEYANSDASIAGTIYDQANVYWGEGWTLPSYSDFNELFNKEYTTTTQETVAGVSGVRVTSNTNGNSIFLPAAGVYGGTWHQYDQDSIEEGVTPYGFYWIGTTPGEERPDLGWSYTFYFDGDTFVGFWYAINREFGATVRPVSKSLKH